MTPAIADSRYCGLQTTSRKITSKIMFKMFTLIRDYVHVHQSIAIASGSLPELYLRILEKPAKIAKIRTHKNLVSHGNSLQ